jgi:hypothetical protein
MKSCRREFKTKAFVPADLTGTHTIEIVLGDGSNAAN